MNEYTPTNILITGGCGFIGSNFILYLLNQYPSVNIINIDKLDYCSTTDLLTNSKQYKFICADISQYNVVKLFLNKYNIDTVVHFAAQTHVDNSFTNSIEFTKSNVLGTHYLIEACREYGLIQRFIHISTDETYGGGVDGETFNEDTHMNPSNPYAATKCAAEHIIRSYYYSFKMPIIICRMNNVYGPRQYPEKVIPSFITRLLNGEKCDIHGLGTSKRSFIYVDDVVRGIDTVLRRGIINETYNIGATNEYTVIQLLQDLVSMILGKMSYYPHVNYIPDRLFNDYRYFIDSSKIKALGWEEKVPFKNGLRSTIDWYKNNKNFFNKEYNEHDDKQLSRETINE